MKNYLCNIVFSVILLMLFSCGSNEKSTITERKEITLQTLKDKIKGGWARQTIGCTYGGPTEFKFKGSIIQDYQNMVWYDDYIKEIFDQDPGLYDDVYGFDLCTGT